MNMSVKKFASKYQGRILEDAGAYKSDEFLMFARDFKAMTQEIAGKINALLVRFSIGHYDVSGFIERDGRYVYFSYSEPRHMPIDLTRSDALRGILVRTAKGPKDYHGGSNNFANVEGFQTLLDACLR